MAPMTVAELMALLADLPDYYPVDVQVGYHRKPLARLALIQDSRTDKHGIGEHDATVFVRLLG